MPAAFLPYGRQTIEDDDIAAVVEALKADFLTTGPTVAAFETAFAEKVGARHAVACSNGTAALHLAMLALGVQPRGPGHTRPAVGRRDRREHGPAVRIGRTPRRRGQWPGGSQRGAGRARVAVSDPTPRGRHLDFRSAEGGC